MQIKMKKFAILLLLCASSLFSQEWIDSRIVEVAREIKYPTPPNYFSSKGEIEGTCGDYALLFALKTGAYIVFNKSIMEKNGIQPGHYKIIRQIPWEENPFLHSHFSKYNNKMIGVTHEGKTYMGSLRWGLYEVSLVKPVNVHYHFGKDVYNSKISHAWNVLNDRVIDVSWWDCGNSKSPYCEDRGEVE
jgi:hypothetical protein